jgi:hypothetical protein
LSFIESIFCSKEKKEEGKEEKMIFCHSLHRFMLILLILERLKYIHLQSTPLNVNYFEKN